jgi:hypothetical protein
MPEHERAMLAYVRLADVSRQRRQALGADKFLILAGAAACRAGWPEVAQRCRQLVIADNPNHLVGHTETFPDAMRSRDFQAYLKQLERFASYELAEHLLGELGVSSGLSDRSPATAGEWSLSLLSGGHWNRQSSGA